MPTLLAADLALAAESSVTPQVARIVAANDPLRLDLPPLPGRRATPGALRTASALYLAARLEETNLLTTAEWLVRERATLRVPGSTAARLEDLARRQARDHPAERRALLFAQLFGVGPGVSPEVAGNTRFEPMLAVLCSALVGCGPQRAGLPDRAHAAVAQAGFDLVVVAGQGYADGLTAALPVLNDQLRRAIDLLIDPGVGALVGTRGLWATLRALLGPRAPDMRRLLDCGRGGQRVLHWLADATAAAERRPDLGPDIPPDCVTSAATWLGACGLVPPRAGRDGS